MRRPLLRPFPRFWFLRTPAYRLFVVRELTSVGIAVYLVLLLVWLHRLGQGPEPYQTLLDQFRHPGLVALHVIALLCALLHSITWFNLTPAVMPVRLGEEKLSPALVAVAMGYLPWVVISGAMLWAVLR